MKIFVTLALLAAFNAQAMNSLCKGDSLKLEGDKQVHALYSAGIGAVSRAVVSDPYMAFTLALAPGLYREMYRGSCFSWQDMAYNAIGAAIGVSTTHWVIGPNKVIFRVEF